MSNRKAIDYKDKLRVFRFYNFTCAACGFYDEYGFCLTVDHIVPVAKGGKNSIDNLQCLCQTCNLIKGKKTMPALPVRKKPDMTVSYESYMIWVNQNRMDFFTALKSRSAGWFKRRDDSLKLTEKRTLTQSQRDRLSNALQKTFNLKKPPERLDNYITIYRAMLLQATPANQQCELAY